MTRVIVVASAALMLLAGPAAAGVLDFESGTQDSSVSDGPPV